MEQHHRKRNRISDGVERRRGKADGISNPLGAYDLRKIFFTPQMLVALHKEELLLTKDLILSYINPSKDS